MARKVNHIFDFEVQIILIHNMVNLLLVVHDEERLGNSFLFEIVLYIFSIGFEGHQPASRQLPNLSLGNFIGLRNMEFKLIYFF